MNTWQFLNNQFDNATRTSFKKSVILSTYHEAALLARKTVNPAYLPIYERYHPVHLLLVGLYNSWRSAGGAQQGQTLSLEQQFTAAYGKLDDWIPAIQMVYKKTTPRYKTIFPDGLKPFRKGSLDQRINAFDTLSMNIGSDGDLTAIKTQIDNTYEALDETRENQQGAKSTVKGGSSQLETARIAAMNMQYRNLGFIMDEFFDTREAECTALFDLQTLRESEQSSFTVTLDPEETEAVLIHTFLTDDLLRCRIDTNGPVSLYLASSPGGIDSTAVVLNNVTETTFPITAFGDINFSTHRYLTAVSAAEEVTKLRVVLE